MGHLQHGPEYAREQVPMQRILTLIGEQFPFVRTSAEFDATAQSDIRKRLPALTHRRLSR